MLVVEGGAGAGGAAIATPTDFPMYVQNSILIVRDRISTDNRYLRYWLESLNVRGYIDFACNKATIPHFTKEKLGETPYLVVPVSERIAISDYLDEKTHAINTLIAEKETLISGLETYKKALIFEVVTGKRRVE